MTHFDAPAAPLCGWSGGHGVRHCAGIRAMRVTMSAEPDEPGSASAGRSCLPARDHPVAGAGFFTVCRGSCCCRPGRIDATGSGYHRDHASGQPGPESSQLIHLATVRPGSGLRPPAGTGSNFGCRHRPRKPSAPILPGDTVALMAGLGDGCRRDLPIIDRSLQNWRNRSVFTVCLLRRLSE